jgi:hypothetical protein
MLNRRGRLLWLTVEAAAMPLPDHPGVRALRGWLDSWHGIGDLERGLHRQGFDLQLARYAEDGWRCTFFTTGKEHSLTSTTGSAWEKTSLARRPAGRRAGPRQDGAGSMIAWPSAAEVEFWLALFLVTGSLWWFWLGTQKIGLAVV